MTVYRTRICHYYGIHAKLPSSLEDVPNIPGRSDIPIDLRDGWGRPIQYHRVSGNEGALTSLGADGAIGGEGLDADIVLSFTCKDEDEVANLPVQE